MIIKVYANKQLELMSVLVFCEIFVIFGNDSFCTKEYNNAFKPLSLMLKPEDKNAIIFFFSPFSLWHSDRSSQQRHLTQSGSKSKLCNDVHLLT